MKCRGARNGSARAEHYCIIGVINGKNRRKHKMKLPLSVLMYRLTEDHGCGYETVNVDVSMEFEGIKLMDMAEDGEAEAARGESGRYIYLIDEEEFENEYDTFLSSERMSSQIYVCLCRDEKSAVCTSCRELSVVFLFADVKFAYMFNCIQNIMKKFDEWEKSFHLSVLRNNSMQELVDITEELMTHPLIVLDNNYSLIGHTRDMTEVGPLVRSVIANGYASPDDMRNLVESGVMSNFDSSETLKICEYRLDADAVRERGLDRDTFYSIAYRFVTGGRTVGYALAFHCLSHPTNGYLYLMNMIADKLSLYFEQHRKNENAARESYETFLAGILANPDMTERQMNEQAGHIRGLQTKGRFVLAQLLYDSIDDLSYSFISWSLRNSMPQFMPFVYRNSFYVLKDCSASEAAVKTSVSQKNSRRQHDGSRSSGFLDEYEKPLFFKCFRNIDYTCGVSSMFFSLKNLRTAAAQCREALSTGRSALWNSPEIIALRNNGANARVKHDDSSADTDRRMIAGAPGGASSDAAQGSGAFYMYSDMAFIHLISQLRRVMPSDALDSPHFMMLSEYDIKHDTDLCAVMAQYIVCGCSVTRTASAMYMHRNTILNKVKKAADVMGDPLEDFTAQVFFMISYINSIA